MNTSRTLRSFLILALLCCSAVWLSGQSFRRDYNPVGSYCLDMVETADGGFLMVGGNAANSTLFMQRTDANGAVLWTNHASLNGARGVAVCRTADGGFAVLGENYADAGDLRNILLRIDANGAMIWQKILENPAMTNGFHDIIATADGGFAIAGEGRVLVPDADFFMSVRKLDSSGGLVWQETIGLSSVGQATELASRLYEQPNGDLIVAGELRGDNTLGGADFIMARLDAAGNTVWGHVYIKPGYQRLRDFQVMADGSMVFFGEALQTYPARAALLKTDAQGQELWYRELQPLIEDNGNLLYVVQCFARDNAGNLYIPLHATNTFSETSLSLLKVSAAGDSLWTHASDIDDLPAVGVYTSDNYFAFGGRSSLNSSSKAVLIKSDWSAGSSSFFSTLTGSVLWDKNNNCQADSGEPGPPQFWIDAENQAGDHFYQPVKSDGTYAVAVPPGSYHIQTRPQPGTSAFWTACDTPTVQVPAVGLTVQAPQVRVQSASSCPYLEVELGSGPIRRCTTAVYYASYCNFGNATATDATLTLSVDPLLSFVYSSVPFASQTGSTYTFFLGDLDPGECETAQIKFLVSCAAVNGQAMCAEAHIYPDSSCVPPGVQWDGSHLVVDAACNGSAQFKITNLGNPMAGPSNYVIIEDQIMYMQGSFQLGTGADTTIAIPNPAGNSYWFQAEQRPGHPGLDKPTAVADMCSGTGGPSLSLQLPQNDADPFIDIHCQDVVGSFDPNDKRGFPLGWRDEHYLVANQDIEYRIRFQNTGNDTAFLVQILDNLPLQLDPGTIRPGAASHPYTYKMLDNNSIQFSFANILLPDSTTNEAESHGFVSFRIAQRPNLPDGTRIENSAAIYFDFNDPVITNTWFHTIGRPLVTYTLDRPKPGALLLQVFPNPASTYVDFRLGAVAPDARMHLAILDPLGRPVYTSDFSGASFRFEAAGLTPGLYFFQVNDETGRAAGGRLVVKF